PRSEAGSRVDGYEVVRPTLHRGVGSAREPVQREGVLMSARESLVLVHNTERDRFELWDGETFMGLVGYEVDGDVFILLHTVIEEPFGPPGIARLLVSLVLTPFRADGGKNRPVFSFCRPVLGR